MKDDFDLTPEYGTYADTYTVKALILEKRHNLIEAFDKYLEVINLREKEEYPPGWIRWMQSLSTLYLEMRSKLTGKERYKKTYEKTIELMDAVIIKNKKLNFEEANHCTLALIDFCEEIGVTDILFEKQDKGRAILGKW